MKGTPEIKFPVYFSDNWLEKNVSVILPQIKTTEQITLDFSRCQWVELSALINITGVLINNCTTIRQIDILFLTGDASPSKEERNAFFFIIESNFFIALGKSLKKHNGVCYIWFKVNASGIDNVEIQNKLAKSFNHYDKSDNLNKLFPIREDKQGRSLIGINLNEAIEDIRIDSSFFSIFNYIPEKQRDYFLIPIKYYTKNELTEIFESKNILSFIKDDLFKDVDKNEIVEITKKQNIIIDIQNVYLPELISNSIDHSNKDVNIIVALRLGSWQLREKNVGEKYYWDECYSFKYKYYSSNKIRYGQRFIDLFVVDSGDGFSTLEKGYNEDNNKPTTQDIVPISLHRYALFPHTTSKSRSSNDDDAIRITGLGVIAENIIIHDGLIAIKDKDKLSFFDGEALKNISNSGYSEVNKLSDMGLTHISSFIPVADETWVRNNYVETISEINKNTTEELFIFIESNLIPLTYNEYYIYNSINKVIKKENTSLLFNKKEKRLCIIDITNILNIFQKNTIVELRKQIIKLKNLGFPVIVYGGNISVMKILQSTIESVNKLIELNIYNLFNDSTLLCPIVTNDLKIFFCGRLEYQERKDLFEYFSNGKLINSISNIINEWGKHFEKLPFRTIERSINRIHGERFRIDIEKSHYFKGVIQDIHGNLIDSYYEVNSYIGLNKEKWELDFLRIISISKLDLIIVDCPEMRLLISNLIKEYDLQLSIGRINNKTIEISKLRINKDSRVLIILSSAYSGSIINSIPEYRNKYELNIIKVITILDLTGLHRNEIEGIIECEYDRFSIGKRPEKIEKIVEEPDYFVTTRARLVSSSLGERDTIDPFKTHLNEQLISAALRQSTQVNIGHVQEHDHHYDVFIDVRSAIYNNDRLNQHFRNLLQNRINAGYSIITYPEDSELTPILKSVKYAPGNKLINTFPIRRIDNDTFVWSNIAVKNNIKGENIIFLDEGIYSGISVIGIINLILKEQPRNIDIVVLEKRLTEGKRNLDFEKIFKQEQGTTKINYYCVFNLSIPSWEESECPYCKLKVPFHINKPKEIGSIKIGSKTINSDVELYLWFLSGIYNSRKQAKETLFSSSQLLDKHPVAFALTTELIITHIEILIKWNLLKDAINYIEILFNKKDDLQIVNIIRKVKRTKEGVRYKIIESLINKIIYRIDNQYIYYELSDLILESASIVPLLLNKTKSLVLPKNIKENWDSLLKLKKYENFYRAITYLFMVTKINKSDPHKTLAKELELFQLNEESIVRIQILKDIISLIEPVPSVLQRIKNSLNNDIKVIVKELIILLNDKEHISEIINQLSVPLSTLINEIKQIVSDQNYNIPKSLLRVKKNNIIEEPLLGIQYNHYILLMSHYKDNKIYGECFINVTMENEYITIQCESKENIHHGSKSRFDSMSKFSINECLLPYGGSLEYDESRGKYVSIVKLKIVDYVKIQITDLR